MTPTPVSRPKNTAALGKWRERWIVMRQLMKARKNMIPAWPKSFYKKDMMSFRVFGKTLFIVNHPAGVQRVLASNSANYPKSPLNTQALKPLLGDGLFVSEGPLWARQRKIAAPSTHRRRLDGYSEVIIAEGARQAECWSGSDAYRDVTEEFTLLTAGVISRLMFGFPLGERDGRELYESFKDYQASHGRAHLPELFGLPVWFPRWSMIRGRNAVRRFDKTLLEIFKHGEKTTGDEEPNLVDMLLAYRDEDGKPMPPQLIRDEMASMFLAGHETTAITLSWAFYLIERHPDVEAALHDEVDRVLGGRLPTHEDVAHLVYTRAIIDETLRLYPPVHIFSKQAAAADEIMNRKVPAGSIVIISTWLLHRHQAVWQDPNEFRPARFLPGTKEKTHPFAYVPFGAGPRVCLGKHLGMLEAVLLMAILAGRFRLRLKPGHEVAPLGRMTLRPEHGMPMRFELRSR